MHPRPRRATSQLSPARERRLSQQLMRFTPLLLTQVPLQSSQKSWMSQRTRLQIIQAKQKTRCDAETKNQAQCTKTPLEFIIPSSFLSRSLFVPREISVLDPCTSQISQPSRPESGQVEFQKIPHERSDGISGQILHFFHSSFEPPQIVP